MHDQDLAGAGAPEDADIRRRADVHDLVVSFYRDVVFDDLLAPVFGEVAEVDWAEHIPKLIDYWCRVLFGEVGERQALLTSHRAVHAIEPLRIEHLDRWYELWVVAVDARWAGPTATRAKAHAAHVGGVLARRILDVAWCPGVR